MAIRYTLVAPAVVRIRIEREGRWVASPLVGSFVPATLGFTWNGQRVSGLLRDGAYLAVVEATGGVGVISYGVPFVSDTVAPRVRILPGKRVRVEVSEPSTLTFVIDGQSLRREVREGRDRRDPVGRVCRSGSRRRVGRCRERQRSRCAHPAPRLAAGAGQ